LDTRNITSAIEQGRITEIPVQAPSIKGVTKTYKLPSGHTLLRIATQEEIAAAEAAAAAAEEEESDESDDDQGGFDLLTNLLKDQGTQIIEPADAEESDDDQARFDRMYVQINEQAELDALAAEAEGQDLADEYNNSGIFDDDAEDEYS
jgi:hypothetical protein